MGSFRGFSAPRDASSAAACAHARCAEGSATSRAWLVSVVVRVVMCGPRRWTAWHLVILARVPGDAREKARDRPDVDGSSTARATRCGAASRGAAKNAARSATCAAPGGGRAGVFGGRGAATARGVRAGFAPLRQRCAAPRFRRGKQVLVFAGCFALRPSNGGASDHRSEGALVAALFGRRHGQATRRFEDSLANGLSAAIIGHASDCSFPDRSRGGRPYLFVSLCGGLEGMDGIGVRANGYGGRDVALRRCHGARQE